MMTNRFVCFAMLVGLLWGLGNAIQAAEPGLRSVTDMAGRAVRFPEQISRVVTLGSLPVLNSFVFTMGEGRTIVNGLADFGFSSQWKYQLVFASHLAQRPTMQQPNRDPNMEAILLAKPDVVLTMHRASVDLLEQNSIPTIFLAWREPEDVKACIALLGGIFHKPVVAERYRRYFDDTLARVTAKVGGLPISSRPTVRP
jgi:iron complex transport system substrate-binding protein